MNNLEGFCLNENKIRKIDTNIVKLSSITDLTVDDNNIEELPDVLCQFKNLKFLGCSNNPIKNADNIIPCFFSNYPFQLRIDKQCISDSTVKEFNKYRYHNIQYK